MKKITWESRRNGDTIEHWPAYVSRTPRYYIIESRLQIEASVEGTLAPIYIVADWRDGQTVDFRLYTSLKDAQAALLDAEQDTDYETARW